MSNSRLLKLPTVSGIKPEKELDTVSTPLSLEALVMELGIVPENLLNPKLKNLKIRK